MAYVTKDMKIATLEAQVAKLKGENANLVKEWDACRRGLEQGADDAQRVRIAALLFPERDPGSIHWDDIAQEIAQEGRIWTELRDKIKTVADDHSIYSDGSSLAIMERIDGNLDDAQEEKDGETKKKEEAEEIAAELERDVLMLLSDLGFDTYGVAGGGLGDTNTLLNLKGQLSRMKG